jgi:hypothetical protein
VVAGTSAVGECQLALAVPPRVELSSESLTHGLFMGWYPLVMLAMLTHQGANQQSTV